MNRIKTIIISIVAILGLSATPVLVPSLASAAPKDELCRGIGGCGNNQGQSVESLFKTISNILLFIIGAVAVIMIIVGGLRYVTSGGDSSSVNGAKNTILYAVVGLVVAAAAYGIVNFVVGKL